MKHTIKKGNHYSSRSLVKLFNFFRLRRSTRPITESFFFKLDQTAHYCEEDILKGDCKDWNKLVGVSYSPKWDSMKNSVMLGWRHTSKGGIEIQPYFHDNDGKAIHDIFTPLSIKAGEEYLVALSYDSLSLTPLIDITVDPHTLQKEWKLDYSNTIKYHFQGVKKSKWYRVINTYFGGNRKAPQNIDIQLPRWSL